VAARSRSSSCAVAAITAAAFANRIALMFEPIAIAALMTVALVVAASHVKNGSKTPQNTDTLKNLILQELYIRMVLLQKFIC
jgi:hypothetical protein